MDKQTVYRWADVNVANAHFRNLHSWFRAKSEDRRIITGEAHDDYVDSEALNDFVGGSVPRHLLAATDEDVDVVADPKRKKMLQKQGLLS